MRRLLPIVEGHGEIPAVPILIRNILAAQGIHDVQPLPARRHGEYPGVAKKFDNIFLAAIKENAPILWIMDFDSKGYDCPVKEAQNLLTRAEALRPGWPIAIAFLVKEYETLFLIDEAATRKVLTDIPAKTAFPQNPEQIRGTKQWLSDQQPSGKAYKETVHQAKITADLNLDLLREKSADFAHLERSVLKLIDAPIPA